MVVAKGSILVVDDEVASRESLKDVLTEEGYDVAMAANGRDAADLLDGAEFDVVITDLRMPGLDGVGLLREVRRLCPQTLVILMTAHASVETAVEALRQGAHDYMIKPLVFDEVLTKVARLLERRELAWQIQYLRREVESRFDIDNMIGESAAMRHIMAMIHKVAPTNSTVLVTGESGVGKEVVARAIHRESERRDSIFLPVNCGAIPEALLESQLFGHLKGSFTGAVTAQEGLFQRARGGTIFLDEVGELPLALQVKLLRAIEEKEIMPVGGNTASRVDLRIIAATNRDLARCCQEGTFREDLYYRLNVFGIEIPPLRDRREDIPALVEFLVRRHNTEMNRRFRGVDNAAMKALLRMPWKGNIRELDNVIEHAMIVGDGEWITIADLPNRVSANFADDGASVGDELKSAIQFYERGHISNVLQRSDGDKRRAAELLGISLSSLYRKIEELSL
ncbi:MAG: sigma-54-dependent transcriptional regulator [Candidatus Binatia bacterium]